jgi:adenylate cyclase class 2
MNLQGQETEVKFYVLNLAAVESRLKALAAVCLQPRAFEHNLRFDTPSGELRKRHSVLRLRQSNNTILTFKGPSQEKDGVLSRREIEIQADPFSESQQLLEALGYMVVFIYEKYRAVFELDGCRVMLDELPYGSFVEIEGEDVPIHSLADRLNLHWGRAITVSYQALMEKTRLDLGLTFQDLTFANFETLRTIPKIPGIQPAD